MYIYTVNKTKEVQNEKFHAENKEIRRSLHKGLQRGNQDQSRPGTHEEHGNVRLLQRNDKQEGHKEAQRRCS